MKFSRKGLIPLIMTCSVHVVSGKPFLASSIDKTKIHIPCKLKTGWHWATYTRSYKTKGVEIDKKTHLVAIKDNTSLKYHRSVGSNIDKDQINISHVKAENVREYGLCVDEEEKALLKEVTEPETNTNFFEESVEDIDKNYEDNDRFNYIEETKIDMPSESADDTVTEQAELNYYLVDKQAQQTFNGAIF